MNEKTNGKIKEILPGSANTETRVILVNALYFKAEWQHPFIEGATGFKKFYPQGKESNYTVQAELMAHGGELETFKRCQRCFQVVNPCDFNAKLMFYYSGFNPEKIFSYYIDEFLIKLSIF